jgi:hypothetical protein
MARYADEKSSRSDTAKQVRRDVIRAEVNPLAAVGEREVRAIVDKDFRTAQVWQSENSL